MALKQAYNVKRHSCGRHMRFHFIYISELERLLRASLNNPQLQDSVRFSKDKIIELFLNYTYYGTAIISLNFCQKDAMS